MHFPPVKVFCFAHFLLSFCFKNLHWLLGTYRKCASTPMDKLMDASIKFSFTLQLWNYCKNSTPKTVAFFLPLLCLPIVYLRRQRNGVQKSKVPDDSLLAGEKSHVGKAEMLCRLLLLLTCLTTLTLFVYVYVFMHVCMCVCIHACVYVCVLSYEWVYVCICMCCMSLITSHSRPPHTRIPGP